MSAVIGICTVILVLSGLIGSTLRLRRKGYWLMTAAVVGVFVTLTGLLGASEVLVEAILATIATSILTRIIFRKAKEDVSISFVVITSLVSMLVCEAVMGPKLRGARELGRRQIIAPQKE